MSSVRPAGRGGELDEIPVGVVAVNGLGRLRPVALDPIEALDLPDPRNPLPGDGGATNWERYVADLRRRMNEVHAMLSVAERTLARDVLGPRPEAAVRLVREQWSAAVGKLDDLVRDPIDARPTPQIPILEALGREHGLVRFGTRTTRLSRRHTEILVLLARQPRGMSTEQIAVALYGDPGRPGTVRTALCRLRKALAPWVHTEGNHVKLEIEADFLIVQRLLRAGQARHAARRYTAALLPHSEAPGVADARDELDTWVRSAVMTCGDREALWAWLANDPGCDDVRAWKRFLADVDFADPRRAVAVSRLARLRSARTHAA
jgi:hypothetical protein